MNARERSRMQSKCKVIVIELGYASDYRVNEKHIEKKTQHLELIAALTAAGWNVKQYIIVLGTGARIFNDTVALLETLEVPTAAQDKALKALHLMATLKVRDILTTRRSLEANNKGIG